jgi:molecular chaperone DnaK (HSP70)
MRLGIDFGTTRTRVAAVLDGNYPLITFHSEEGDTQDWYPSLIATQNGRSLFGLDAQHVQFDPEWELCRSFKRLLESQHPQMPLAIGDLELPLTDWLTEFLSALRHDLLHRSNLEPGSGPLQAMVGIPANANSNQRFLTLEAFRKAGFEVFGMVNEPSAAGMEYAHRYRQSDRTRGREYVAVYDLGGGTFDVSIIRMTGDIHEVVTSEGISRLGGDDFDEILLDLTLAQAGVAEIASKRIARSRLLNLCREAKEGINTNSRKTTIDLGQVSPRGAEVLVPVKDFYESCEPLIAQTLEATESVVRAVTGEDSDMQSLACVYLVGGSCELPVLARSLRERFGKRVRRSPYPSAATAIGLAIAVDQASGYELRDRFHRHFGVWREVESGSRMIFDPIFSKGTGLPKRGQSPLIVTRRYQPAHNVGHFRFAECSQISETQQPRGDIVTWDQIFFPFDPKLDDESNLDRVPVVRWPEGARHEVGEIYRCDSRGIIEVSISSPTTGITRDYRVRVGAREKAKGA